MSRILDITPDNAPEHGFFCIKNSNAPGFISKYTWFKHAHKTGLRIKMYYADDGKQAGFIEYVPAGQAWRPVDAPGYMFIHCLFVYPNNYRSSGAASALINASIQDAAGEGLDGVCTMTSNGPWMASGNVFERQGFVRMDQRGRFDLMAYLCRPDAGPPKLIDWEYRLAALKGWHLFYSDQCPWHDKGIKTILKAAGDMNIPLRLHKVGTAEEAQKVPSGFGTFALVRDGKLLEDHYISERRFRTIVEKELY